MSSKFEIPDTELDHSDPRYRIMEAWADFESSYLHHHDEISVVGRELMIRQMDGEDFDYAVEIEERLQKRAPAFTSAGDLLRNRLDEVRGWQIEWEHHRHPSRANRENVGWVVGSLIGGDSTMLGYRAWMEISFVPADSGSGMMFLLPEMYKINLIPPDQADQG